MANPRWEVHIKVMRQGHTVWLKVGYATETKTKDDDKKMFVGSVLAQPQDWDGEFYLFPAREKDPPA